MVFLSTQICYTIKVEDFIIAKPASHHQAESRPLISAKNHKLNSSKNPIFLIDCSNLELDEKLTCVSLQGVLNRNAPRLFLDYGYYDKLSDRTTNEEFINDELWFGTYRSMIGRQDIRNLEYYQSRYQLDVQGVADYRQLMRDFKTSFRGCVIWDDSLPETISIAVMLSGLESLLILSPGQVWLAGELGLLIAEDLRGRWRDRIDLYRWAVDHLLPRCKPGYAASIDPGWEHPEFFDYIIQNKIFTYSLATDNPNRLFRFGQKLLLLLFAGPRRLRNVLFMARLDKVIKAAARALMQWTSPETRLASRIHRKLAEHPSSTLFGWHTQRDNELSFMLHLSANGMRLVPSHLASNFSFHSRMPGPQEFRQQPAEPVEYDPERIYLTYTLSDGDQLMMMNTAELGNWYQPERGKVPFNWEVQPLLVELAPALLEKYYATATEQDCLVAGPSGAGYTIQPLMDNLAAYTLETMSICQQADIQVITSYDAAPPAPVLRTMLKHAYGILGYLGGYVYFGDQVQIKNQQDIVFITSLWPPLEGINASAGEVLSGIKSIIEQTEPPAFISVHLFAYRTTITDVHEFVQTLDPDRVRVVRADQFLQLALEHLKQKEANHD